MIDFNRPFRLKRMIVDPKSGNIYVPLTERHYLPGEVPKHLLNDATCIQEHFGDDLEVEEIEVIHKTTSIADSIAVSGFETKPTATIIEPSTEYKAETTQTRNLHPLPETTPKKNAKA